MSWLNEKALDIFVNYYYPKAKWLQNNVNWGPLDYEGPEAAKAINDPLMQKIDIYDCFTRNAAGFSNVLQDLRFGSKTPKWRWQNKTRRELNTKNDSIKWDTKTWMYVFLSHRVTGSGASFENDHGYRNNIIQFWGKHRDIKDMSEDLVSSKATGKPLFTSIGNQPPAPKKGVSNVDFLVKELPDVIDRLGDWIVKSKRGHKEIVDFLNVYNKSAGHRKFNFQYAAFSMDCSDYFPEYADVDSHTYLGNNAIRCMKKLSGGWKPDSFMDLLREQTGGKPKDLEDVMCDFVRFGQNYVPRGNGTFDHIPSTLANNSGWNSGWEQRQGMPPQKGIQLEDFMV
tara:strand:+ start:2555 stop:3574 length:1020 start_codon:yes stop_codon:yes gene_type:complete